MSLGVDVRVLVLPALLDASDPRFRHFRIGLGVRINLLSLLSVVRQEEEE